MVSSKVAKKPKKGKKDPWESSSDDGGGDADDDDDDDDADVDVRGKKAESEEKDMDALFDAAKKITPPGTPCYKIFLYRGGRQRGKVREGRRKK